MLASSPIVRLAAASGLAQEFRIALPAKVKIKNRSVYSRLYGMHLVCENRLLNRWVNKTSQYSERYSDQMQAVMNQKR